MCLVFLIVKVGRPQNSAKSKLKFYKFNTLKVQEALVSVQNHVMQSSRHHLTEPFFLLVGVTWSCRFRVDIHPGLYYSLEFLTFSLWRKKEKKKARQHRRNHHQFLLKPSPHPFRVTLYHHVIILQVFSFTIKQPVLQIIRFQKKRIKIVTRFINVKVYRMHLFNWKYI